MEESPLIKAQSLGRTAFLSSADTEKAQQNHDEAAKQYAEAAKGINDTEAQRILRLLESQHQELAKIVKSTTEHPPPSAVMATDAVSDHSSKTTDRKTSSASDSPSKHGRSSPASRRRAPQELRSSIASNLATARGIPSGQQRGPVRAGSPIQEESPAKAALDRVMSSDRHGKRPKSPLSGHDGSHAALDLSLNQQHERTVSEDDQQTATSPGQDAAFQRFYSSFEGLFSKLSAPLAFAGLPLNPASREVMTPAAEEQPPTSASTAPDLNKIYSKAALKAVKDGNNDNVGVHDSFYVVPTGGGTMSYARMLSKEQRHARQGSNDVFVDAPESHAGRARRQGKDQVLKSPNSNKTFEELEVENDSLKELTDNLSKRIQLFERSSQSQTAALQQSIRLMHQPLPQSPQDPSSSSRGLEASDRRIQELEAQMKNATKEIERYKKENEKLKATLIKYRDRWEQLKAGARTRRESSGPGKLQEE